MDGDCPPRSAVDERRPESRSERRHVVLFQVRATDAAGRVGAFATSAPFTLFAAQETDPNIVYAGAWPIAARTNAFGGSTSSTTVAGSTATYTFTGSYVAWVTEKDPTHGQAVVSIDGVATP